MKEWNVRVATYRGQEKKSLRFLSQYGEFKSLLRGHVADVNLFLEKLESVRQENPPKDNFHKPIFGIDEKAKRLKYFIFKPPITIIYITLES
jgi:hypothetical protein